MKDYLKTQILVLSLAICLFAILSFWALEKNSCFEVNLIKQLTVKAGFCN